MIFDLLAALVHAPQFQRTEVYVPESIADFLEADVFTGQGVRDADPSLLPANPAVAADEAHLEVTRVFEGRQALWQLARRRHVVLGGGLLIEGLVRAASKRSRVSTEYAARG